MKEKKNIFGSIFGRDRENEKQNLKTNVEHKNLLTPVKKTKENRIPAKDVRTIPSFKTAENDKYNKNLVKEATDPANNGASVVDKGKDSNNVNNKTSLSNGQQNAKRSYTPVSNIPLPKPLLSRNLTIFLVEETTQMNPYIRVMFEKSLSVVNNNDFLCVIRYSENVNRTIKVKYKFNEEELEANYNIKNDKKCFYEALKYAYDIVDRCCFTVFEDSKYRYKIENTELIGIGTASDNSSKISLEEAIAEFDKILKKGIKTKYFCIDDIQMKDAAVLGFRNVGSINLNFNMEEKWESYNPS